MTWLKKARAVGGLATIGVLLGLFVAEFFYAGTLEPGRVRVLLALIAALLGLDLAGERLPFQIEVSKGETPETGAENDREND